MKFKRSCCSNKLFNSKHWARERLIKNRRSKNNINRRSQFSVIGHRTP